ncbi:FIG00642633: hypothetical protein [Escherichia coli IS35]|nr:FIG00642633: hypothetical protein [Escherichia coli IS35]
MFLHTVTGYLLPYHHGYQRTGIHALREALHYRKHKLNLTILFHNINTACFS